MFTLVTTFRLGDNQARNSEILYCLKSNIDNHLFDHLYIFTETIPEDPLYKSDKVTYISTNEKPSFRTLVDYSNVNLSNKIICLTNADIFFDDTLANIKQEHLDNKYAFCLTRWNYDLTSKAAYFMNVGCSFDTYIYPAPLVINNIDFRMGIPGCDNRFARELHNVGKKMINPSRLVKTYHVHDSGVRNYSERDRLGGDYLSVEPIDTIEYRPALLYFGK